MSDHPLPSGMIVDHDGKLIAYCTPVLVTDSGVYVSLIGGESYLNKLQTSGNAPLLFVDDGGEDGNLVATINGENYLLTLTPPSL